MKKLFFLICISLSLFTQRVMAQISVEAVPIFPQTGQYNYFGVKVTLPFVYASDVVVTGTIHAEGNATQPFSLTVIAGDLTAETALNFYQADPTATANADMESFTTGYAGVNITYEAMNCILNFPNYAAVLAVINQLIAEDDAYNDDYDSQYPNMSEEELDAMDEQNGFDDLQKFKDFENLFNGFCSKRSEIEAIENAWLANSFAGTDPYDVDLTLEEAENTIFNSNYAFKIGSDFYQLTPNGFYKNGIILDIGGNAWLQKYPLHRDFPAMNYAINSGPYQGQEFAYYFPVMSENIVLTDCKSNKKVKDEHLFDNDTKKLRLKVGINSVWFGSNVKAKAVSFKKKNSGGWKRTRTKMAVSLGGTVYEGDCNGSFPFNQRNPVNDFKKRKRLKYSKRSPGQVPGVETNWKTYSGLIGGSLEAPNLNFAGSLLLTF